MIDSALQVCYLMKYNFNYICYKQIWVSFFFFKLSVYEKDAILLFMKLNYITCNFPTFSSYKFNIFRNRYQKETLQLLRREQEARHLPNSGLQKGDSGWQLHVLEKFMKQPTSETRWRYVSVLLHHKDLIRKLKFTGKHLKEKQWKKLKIWCIQTWNHVDYLSW